MKPKLDEMTREAREGAARARELRGRLEEVTATVDGLVVEARSTLRRAVEFLEREGLRESHTNVTVNGKKKGAADGARRKDSPGKSRDRAPDSRRSRE